MCTPRALSFVFNNNKKKLFEGNNNYNITLKNSSEYFSYTTPSPNYKNRYQIPQHRSINNVKRNWHIRIALISNLPVQRFHKAITSKQAINIETLDILKQFYNSKI